jgi:hypothetical protein
MIALVITAAGWAGGGAPARAADDPREVRGRALFAKGEYEAALDVYAELFAEKVDPIYLRNIGRCNQKLRRPAKAIDAFREYLRRVRRIKADEREEIEGFIREMEALQADMDRKAEREKAEREKASGGDTPAPAARPPTPSPPPPDADAGLRAVGGPAAPVAPPPPETAAATARPLGQSGQLFVAVIAGTGFGIASGHGEINPAHRAASTGFAPAQLGHLAPEVGFFPAPRLLLSAQLRLQYVSNTTGEAVAGSDCGGGYCVPEKLALAGFGRIGWLFGDGSLRGLLALAAGGGNIRHVALFNDDKKCGPMANLACVDTFASGPFLIGPSIGLFWELGSVVSLIAQINSVVGYPAFTIHFDANLGLGFRI